MYNNQKENDWELRKRLRLEQVRQQSKEFAHELRNKVFNEQKVKLKEIEHTKKTEHKNWQRKTLNVINQEYIECLKNIGASHANALLGQATNTEEKKEKLTILDNICFKPTTYAKPDKLLPAVVEHTKRPINVVAKTKYTKQNITKVKPMGNKKTKSLEKKHSNTQTENHLLAQEHTNFENNNIELLGTILSAPQNTVKENKENENLVPETKSKPYFSQISQLLKKSSLPQSTTQDNTYNDKLVPEPHFSQISNLLKKSTVSQSIIDENNENEKNVPALNIKPHFTQVSNLIKQRRAGLLCTTTNAESPTKEPEDLKRRPSVVSFKTTKDTFSVPYTSSEVSRQQTVYDKSQINERPINDEYRPPILDSKVQMYDNRTKFAKEYIPQQSLTQRTSTNRDSPNAMELADQENERMRLYLNAVDERLKRDLERGENAIEREKVMRKHKTLINELDKLATEEKMLKTYIQSHQPPQYEPKIQNIRDFMEKRTIITSSEVRKQNSNYINVASIRSTSSEGLSEDSRKSIVLDYEESLILENLSETNVNVDLDAVNRFTNKISPMLTRKSTKGTETPTRVRDDVIQTINVPAGSSNGKKLFDAPIKITIQIQQSSEAQEPAMLTPQDINLRLPQLESNTSSLTEYRSLPKTFTGSSKPPTEQVLTDISKPTQKNENLHQTHEKIIKEAELECYIRRLLQMSKESVDKLPSVTDLSSIRESIVDTTSNTDESKYSNVENMKTPENPIKFGSPGWRKESETDFSGISKYSSTVSETSSISRGNTPKVSIQNATSYSILNNSLGNSNDLLNQYKTYNQRIIELTDLMSKVRIERQQILERTSLSSETGNIPNNTTEYHELPSRLLLVPKNLPPPAATIEKTEENKRYHELSTIIETGLTPAESKLEKSSTVNVDKIINEVFTQSTSDPKIDVVPYQSEEKLEETINRSDSQESLLEVFAELKRRNIFPNVLKNLVKPSDYKIQSPNSIQLNDDETESSIATESLLSISSSINFNRRSLLAHSISANGKSTSSTSSSISKPALNLKEFLDRELSNKNSSSDSATSSKEQDVDKVHRTSTPVIKHTSSKSLYLSIDAQSNLFSGESQISSVKSNTTTSTWGSA